MTSIQWQGVDGLLRAMEEYGRRVQNAVLRVAQYWAAVFETYAKENAPWTDRTANARQSLHTFIEELSQDVVRLYLSHGVEYGLWLEIRWSGRYAIIWPTIEAHLEQIRRMLQEIFA